MSQRASYSLDRTRTTFPEDLRRVTPLQRSLSAGPRLQTQVGRALALVNVQHVPAAVLAVILVSLHYAGQRRRRRCTLSAPT